MSITKEELEGIWSSEDKAYQYATAELIQQLLHRIKVHIKTVNRTRAYRQSTSPAFDVTNCLTGINVKSEDLYVLRVISPKHAKDVAELVVRDLGARSLSQIAEDWIANDFITELKRVSDVADVNGAVIRRLVGQGRHRANLVLHCVKRRRDRRRIDRRRESAAWLPRLWTARISRSL